jgi:hypothetical protein
MNNFFNIRPAWKNFTKEESFNSLIERINQKEDLALLDEFQRLRDIDISLLVPEARIVNASADTYKKYAEELEGIYRYQANKKTTGYKLKIDDDDNVIIDSSPITFKKNKKFRGKPFTINEILGSIGKSLYELPSDHPLRLLSDSNIVITRNKILLKSSDLKKI